MRTRARAQNAEAMPWAVYRTSCVELPLGMPALADKTVHHVITDPPYESEAHTRSMRSKAGGGIERLVIPYGAMTERLRNDFAREAVRVCRGWILIFCQVEAVGLWRVALESAGAAWRRAIVWVKPDSTPQFRGDRPGQAFECIAAAWAGASRRSRWNARGKRGLYVHNTNDGGRRRAHPNGKPLPLMEALVNDFSLPGEIIADPFCGAGATGVAAVRLGRRFIGWEIDGVYSERAVRRLKGTREQLDMFTLMSRNRRLPKQMRLHVNA